MGAAWRGIRDLFRKAGIDTAELDARLFAEAAFEMDRLELVNREREAVPAKQLKALEAFALAMLDEHLSHCVVRAAQAGGEEAESKIREASAAIARLVRS